jgi:hypothetical protein
MVTRTIEATRRGGLERVAGEKSFRGAATFRGTHAADETNRSVIACRGGAVFPPSFKRDSRHADRRGSFHRDDDRWKPCMDVNVILLMGQAAKMMLTAVLASGLTSAVVLAEDLSRYRRFQLGTELATVAERTGVSPAQIKVIHPRPVLIQELEWRSEARVRRLPSSRRGTYYQQKSVEDVALMLDVPEGPAGSVPPASTLQVEEAG